MANTIVNSSNNSALVVKKWSAELFKYSMLQNPFAAYMGTNANSIFQVKKDLEKDSGDKVQFDILNPLTGAGQTDDGTYEGNEEALTFGSMEVQIHERGNSVRPNGKMTVKRTRHDLRQNAKYALGEWKGAVMAADMIAALSGLKTMKPYGYITGEVAEDADSSQILTVNQTDLVKGSTKPRYFAGGQTTAGVIDRVADDAAIANTSNKHLFGTAVISEVKAMAEKGFDASGNYIGAVKPIMVDGQPFYVMYVSLKQAKQLRQETAWKSAQQEANLRGKTNPIFTGADGIWDGVIIKRKNQIHERTGDGTGTAVTTYFESGDPCANGVTVARALFCGAQAGLIAYGQMPTWEEEWFDYKTKLGVHADWIYGVARTVFDGDNFSTDDSRNCIVVDTAVSDNS